MPEFKVKCCGCGNSIVRKRKTIRNKYGVWQPKCEECKKSDYRKRQSQKVKERYKVDPQFRERILERAKERYWGKRPPQTTLTPEERKLLAELSSYPVVGPGTLGTSEPTTNWKVIFWNGEWRIKGAIFLESWGKRLHKENV